MAYIITEHAKRRMQQRGISERQAKETIEQPQMKWPDKKMKQRQIHVREYGQRLLKVVWTPENDDACILTAVWLEEGGKS